MGKDADRIPPIRQDVKIVPQYYRGELSYVIKDPVTQNFYRVREIEYIVLRSFQRGMDVEGVRKEVERLTGADVPETEIYKFVNQLQGSSLLKSKGMADVRRLSQNAARTRKMKWKKILSNYLFITIPLWDPDAALKKLMPLYRVLVHPIMVTLWLMIAAVGAWIIVTNFRGLAADAFSLLSGWNLLILSIVIFSTKFVHEMGHALTCKSLGGQVRAIGPAFLVFQPCMYTDTTDAWAFPSKWDRIKVTLAGVASEIVLASVAAFIWISSEPGLVKQVSYTVMVTCTISTVLFNANPLLRFDGYYILSDLLEIPNLRIRTQQYVGYLFDHYILGIEAQAPEFREADKRIYLVYGVARFFYRWVIILGIGLFLLSVFPPLGVIMLVTSFYGMIIQPVWQRGVKLQRQFQAGRVQVRSLIVIGAIVAVALIIWFIPVDYRVKAPCVLAPGEMTVVRAPAGGVLAEVLVDEGDDVVKGQLLAQVRNPTLLLRRDALQDRIQQLNAKIRAALAADIADVEIERREKSKLDAELRLTHEIIDRMRIEAPHDGVVCNLHSSEIGREPAQHGLVPFPRSDAEGDVRDLLGTVVSEGTGVLGIARRKPLMLQAFVSEKDMASFAERAHPEMICRLVSHPAEELHTQVQRIVPVDVKNIENVGITLADIGYIPVKPTEQGENTPLVTLYVAQARLPETDIRWTWGLTGKAYITYSRGPLGAYYVGRVVRNIKLRLQRI